MLYMNISVPRGYFIWKRLHTTTHAMSVLFISKHTPIIPKHFILSIWAGNGVYFDISKLKNKIFERYMKQFEYYI